MKKIQKLYTDLIKEYNTKNYQVVCGLEQFIRTKAEMALERGNGYLYNDLLDVLAYCENDF